MGRGNFISDKLLNQQPTIASSEEAEMHALVLAIWWVVILLNMHTKINLLNKVRDRDRTIRLCRIHGIGRCINYPHDPRPATYLSHTYNNPHS